MEEFEVVKGSELPELSGDMTNVHVIAFRENVSGKVPVIYLRGPKGDPLRFEDLTPQQVEAITGPKGDSLRFEDLTPQQIEAITGPKGDPLRFEDLTPQQIEAITGPKGDPLRFEDLTQAQLDQLAAGIEAYKYSVKTVETKVGQIGILGSDYDLFRIGIEISGIPKVLNEEVTVTIADIPVGMNMYLKVDSLVVAQKSSVVSEYFNSSYEISKLFVDEDLKTKVTIKCIKAVAVDVVAYVQAEYIKGFGEILELSITVPETINTQDVNLTFPKLKYNKSKVVSLVVDDCYSIYNDVFSVINKRWVDNQLLSFFIPGDDRDFAYHLGFTYEKNGVIYTKSEGRYPTKPLEYTDGAGISKRFAFTSAFWAWKMGARDYVGGWAWPWMTPAEARLAFDFGSTVAFHDIEDVDAAQSTNVTQEFFNNAVKKDAALSKQLIDIMPKVMVNPNGDPNYTRLAWGSPDIQFQVAAAIQPDGQGTQFNLDYFKYNSSILLDDKTSTKFIAQRLFYSSGIQEFLDFIATNEARPLNDRVWSIYGVHRPSTPTQQLLESLESLYGKSGDDSMWMPSLDEFFEYWFMTKYGAIHKTINGQTIKFRIYLPCNDNFWFKSASVLASGISDLTGVSVAFSDNCYGGSFDISDNKLLVNFDLNQSVIERADRYLTILETNPSQEYAYDDAAYFVQQIRNDLRTPYQARLDVFGTSPSLNSIVINNGDSETSSRDVTIQLNKVGVHTHVMVSELSNFSGAAWVENSSNTVNYTCSEGYASKTIYVKIKNSFGESLSKTGSITLINPTTVVLNSIIINSGNETTTDRNISVALNLTGAPTHYMISENPEFTESSWLPYSSPSLSFILSEALGVKTIYVKIKDAINESASKYDSITLEAVAAIVLNSISINNGDASTTTQTVTIALSVTGAATHYRIGNSLDLSVESWLPYVANVSYTLPSGEGMKTVYAQVKNATSESTIVSDTISLVTPGVVKAALSLTYPYGNGNVIDKVVGGITINSFNVGVGDMSAKSVKSTTGDNLPWYIEFNRSFYPITAENLGTDTGFTSSNIFNPTLSGNAGPYPDDYINVAKYPQESPWWGRIVFTLPAGTFKFKLLMSVSSHIALDAGQLANSFYRIDVNGVTGMSVPVGPPGFSGLNNNTFNAEVTFTVSAAAALVTGNTVLRVYNTSGVGYRPAVNLIEIQKLS